MGKKNLAKALMAGSNQGMFVASGTPLLIDINNIQVGDEVILWEDSELEKEALVRRGQKYRVSIVDKEFKMIAIEGIHRMYKSENSEYEIGWEYWRFCFPKNYNESGIYLSRLEQEAKVMEFAGRKIFSKYQFPIEDLGIPFKKLRREMFAEIEHPQAEILFQFEVDGTSKLYLTKFENYWLLLHRIRSETDWLIGDNIHSFSLALITPVLKEDKKPVVAQLLLAAWLFHYERSFDIHDKYPLSDLKSRYKVIKGGKNRMGYLTPQQIEFIIHLLHKKRFVKGSEIIREYLKINN